MIWHNSTVLQTASELDSNIETGLASEDAELRLKEYGKNELQYTKKTSFLSYLLEALSNFTSIALIIVALINFVLTDAADGYGKHENIIIILLVLISSVLLAVLKYISDSSFLKASTNQVSYATVIRNGQEVTIKSNHIVPGDIMLIKAGDYIKADGRLIDSYALTCDETMVSGDMAPSEKMHDVLLEDITPLVNRHNMVYAGSFVLNGKGTVLVTETGLATEVGMHKDIKKQLEDIETPLTSRLIKIAHSTSVFALIAAIITFFAGIIANFSGMQFAVTVTSNLLLAISLYFSVFHNIIPSIIVFSRTCAISRLKSKNVFINSKLISEELKDTTIICTDKTGVLTTEELTVLKVFNGIETVNLANTAIDDSTSAVLRLALICSNFLRNEHGERHTNNVERSIESACIKYLGMSKTDIDGLYPKISEIPFDSDRMLMTTVSAINSSPVSITKGAPEVVFSRCADLDIDDATKLASSYAKEGLKVIAVAIKQLDEIPVNPNKDELENDLTFVGIIGIDDKISSKAAKLCIEAASSGIKTIMVTGDHKDTAIAISKKAGIISDDSQAISGEELSLLSDEELLSSIHKYTVFARISPEDKLRIVAALKANNEKVLITGDCVNDTPALVEADFGCALGYTASDMVKDSADLVIEDNHYSSIVYAIKESAKIYSNTRKALLHLFTVGISAILLTLMGLIIFGKSPLASAALVLHCLLSITLPLYAFFTDNAKQEMDLSSKGNKLFDKLFVLRSFLSSIIIVTFSLVAYGINLNSGITEACGAAFTLLSFGHIINAVCILSDGSLLSKKILKQKIGILICVATLLLLLLISCSPVGAIISLSSFSSSVWVISIISTVLIMVSHETIKFLKIFA